MEHLDQADWEGIRGYRDQIFMVEAEGIGGYTQLDAVDRNALLYVSKYVSYVNKSFVHVHEIIDRVIDQNNNLILFVKTNGIDLDFKPLF
ncbi:hypothetical protein PP175_21415 [Aneurinibacillus sp. Ricciae_BoGa-3]|uniref:hypothetical protein n=1 Tax=Aneurinibacillus sp. Ricciae_BoGa-3 TaxID=3022697 RepID=UPI0023418B49|nr:hypothetical protein [Aneurinibacillus sp. Ricciae_BoGa-3]WCK53851.1 hypothetical protein PP175_21415 [Aneurinibacillus sp. Ricciae_BoGa-3]